MYGHKARDSIVAILKEAPELRVADAPVVTPKGFRNIADRLLIELWMRGFAVSARKVGAKPPKDAPDQKAWRDEQLAPKPPKKRRKAATDSERSVVV